MGEVSVAGFNLRRGEIGQRMYGRVSLRNLRRFPVMSRWLFSLHGCRDFVKERGWGEEKTYTLGSGRLTRLGGTAGTAAAGLGGR